MKKIYLACTIISLLLLYSCRHDHSVKIKVDWEDFLSRHDLHWSRMPMKWEEAPFLGNGMMGTMVWKTGEHTVRWDIGRGDVQDHRPGGDMYNTPRLPIGYFTLNTVGKITGGEMKLDLWNAEASGIIETDKGSVSWRSIIHADKMVLLTIVEPTEGEQDCHWEWHSEEAISPRQASGRIMEGYLENPPAKLSQDGKNGYMIAKDVPFAQRHRHYYRDIAVFDISQVRQEKLSFTPTKGNRFFINKNYIFDHQ